MPGTLFFGHLLYVDDSAYPSEIEIGLLRNGDLHVAMLTHSSLGNAALLLQVRDHLGAQLGE